MNRQIHNKRQLFTVTEKLVKFSLTSPMLSSFLKMHEKNTKMATAFVSILPVISKIFEKITDYKLFISKNSFKTPPWIRERVRYPKLLHFDA